MQSKRLKDVLPELAQIMAKDFSDFSDEWEEVLKTYAEILEWLSSSRLKSEDIEKAVAEVIERYIEKRRYGLQWNEFFPAYKCLAFELGEIPLKLFDKMLEEAEREICKLMEEWDREDYDSDGGAYDETGRL
jgi:predicted CopG family antitoxin